MPTLAAGADRLLVPPGTRWTPYRAPMMGMGNLGPDGRRRQRVVAGIIVAAMLLAAGAVLLGTVL